jgi:hypothetical protein
MEHAMRKLAGLSGFLGATGLLASSLPSCGGSSGSHGGDSTTAGVTCRNYVSTKTVAPLWEQLAPSGSAPQVRYAAASAYDATRDTLMVFGGTDRTSSYNDVRALNNASGASGAPTWTTLQVSGTPPSPRSSSLAAYSSTQDSLFIFGGVDGNNKIQADLWKLANASAAAGTPTWSSVAMAGTAPSPIRGEMSGIYAEQRDMLVFFGGISCSSSSCTTYSDAHAIGDLTKQPTWVGVSPVGGVPPGRFFHSSVYDAANDLMVIFGGNATTNVNGDASANLDDVWVLSNATGPSPSWRELVPATAARPGATMGQSAVYDPSSGRMIVYGGVNTRNTVTTDTWILTGLASSSPEWFAYATAAPRPPSRTLHVAAYAASNRMVVFGGSKGGNTYANDSWALHNANGQPTTPVASITIASASTTICSANWVELTAIALDANGNEVPGVVFVWISSDETIARVDAEGNVTGIREGTVVITVTDQTGTVKATITITVTRSTSSGSGTGGAGGSGGADAGTTDCTCYCGWPANQVCHTNSECPPDTSVPGTNVPGVCGCPIGC